MSTSSSQEFQRNGDQLEKMTMFLNRYLVSAMLARSNFGLPKADDHVYNDPDRVKSISGAVIAVLQDVIENDEQYQMFIEETQSWYKTFSVLSEGEILEDYSGHREQILLCRSASSSSLSDVLKSLKKSD